VGKAPESLLPIHGKIGDCHESPPRIPADAATDDRRHADRPALFDKAIDKLTQAQAELRRNDRPRALPLVSRAQIIVIALADGVRTDVDEQMGTNMLRLYEFVARRLASGQVDDVEAALKVLGTLRDGFRSVRDEAVRLERSGELPALDELKLLAVEA
jgi:flagellar protein FliS